MNKKLLISFLLLIAAIGSKAQTIIVLHQKSGGNVAVSLSDKPVATYEDNEIVITAASTTLRFPLTSLDYVSYEESVIPTVIESITVLGKDAGPSMVYDLDGRLVKTIPQGEPVVLSTLPQGLYIVKNNITSYKIKR